VASRRSSRRISSAPSGKQEVASAASSGSATHLPEEGNRGEIWIKPPGLWGFSGDLKQNYF
jgi:hypothetical protein